VQTGLVAESCTRYRVPCPASASETFFYRCWLWILYTAGCQVVKDRIAFVALIVVSLIYFPTTYVSEGDPIAEVWITINVRRNQFRNFYSRKCPYQVACGEFTDLPLLTALPSLPMPKESMLEDIPSYNHRSTSNSLQYRSIPEAPGPAASEPILVDSADVDGQAEVTQFLSTRPYSFRGGPPSPLVRPLNPASGSILGTNLRQRLLEQTAPASKLKKARHARQAQKANISMKRAGRAQEQHL
jgi:hypothetical protein